MEQPALKQTKDNKNESTVAMFESGPGKKRFWQPDELEKQPDAKLCLKAELTLLLFGFVLRELVPIVPIVLYVFTQRLFSPDIYNRS